MIRMLAVTLGLLLAAASSQAQTPAGAAQACGAKLDGGGKALKFASPLAEDDRIALLAAIYLTMDDPSGRGTWPLSEIDIALPCQIASFPVGEDTWVISAGEGYAPPRWARAEGHDETFFLAAGPSPAEARAWAKDRNAPPASLARSAYYLGAAADEKLFIFKIYQGAPDGKLLADDIFDAVTEKTAPLAVYDSKGAAASLFLLTQSRRTSQVFRPERLDGERTATLYGPDGHFFSPAPGEAVLLRGSDLTCDDHYGGYQLQKLGVLRPDGPGLDLSCRYEGDDGYITIFSTHLPDDRGDRKIITDAIKAAQEDGVARRISSFKVGETEALLGGAAWIDKERTAQGVWFTRRGAYLYEIRLTCAESEVRAALAAVSAFTESLSQER